MAQDARPSMRRCTWNYSFIVEGNKRFTFGIFPENGSKVQYTRSTLRLTFCIERSTFRSDLDISLPGLKTRNLDIIRTTSGWGYGKKSRDFCRNRRVWRI